jgi:membrane associated rhomboid family serine protease
MPPLPPVTKALMLICTAMFCIQWLLPRQLEPWLALWPVASGRFMPWQMLTYAFLHGDVGHLFFNMLGLWMFGGELERLWGQKRFIHFMLAGALAAAVVQIGWTALLLAFGMLFPNRTIMLLIPPIPMKAKYFVALFGAFSLVLGFMGGGGVAHFAHLGGMLGGFLMIRFWRGQSPFGKR